MIRTTRRVVVGIALFCSLPFSALVDLEKAEQIYMQVCFVCHGKHLEGGIGTSLVDPVWQHGDSEEAIANTIRNGIEGTEMTAYGAVFPKDIEHLAEFILSKQMGIRGLEGEYFEFGSEELREVWDTPDSLAGRTPKESFSVAENIIYFAPNVKGLGLLARYRAKLYVNEPGRYQIGLKTRGMARILIGGEEYFAGGDLEQKHAAQRKSAPIKLVKGIYDLEMLYGKLAGAAAELSPILINLDNSRQYRFSGSPLGGLSPVVVSSVDKAKLFRSRPHRDGREFANGGDRVAEMAKPDKIYIGKRSSNSSGVSGVIDDFRIYNKALSPGDVRRAMKSEQAGTPAPETGANPDGKAPTESP